MCGGAVGKTYDKIETNVKKVGGDIGDSAKYLYEGVEKKIGDDWLNWGAVKEGWDSLTTDGHAYKKKPPDFVPAQDNTLAMQQAAEDAKAEERSKQRKRRSRRSTILTSGQDTSSGYGLGGGTSGKKTLGS